MEDNKKAAIEKIYLLAKQDAEFNGELRKKLGITSSANHAVICSLCFVSGLKDRIYY